MMTLMGKLFRPWDLAPEGFENEPKSPPAAENPENSQFKPENHKEEKVESKKRKNDPEESSPQSGKSPKRHRETPSPSKESVNARKREDLPKSCVKKRVVPPPSINTVNNNISCCDSSSYLNSPSILHGGIDHRKFCGESLPLSPADFDYHLAMSMNMNSCSSSANNPSMFLYPNTINELASLSREELTAMGLLPPDPHASLSKVKRQRPKRFHCPHCQVAFSNNGQLRGHVRIHTGERPYKCEEEGCGKSFTRNEELTRHRRIHSGLRPFPCMYCGKKFGRKDHLKKHTRTHQRAMYSVSSSSLSLSPLPIGVGGMIGYGNNPFPAFHPPLLSSMNSGGSNEMNLAHSPYGLPFIPSVPPSASHFPLFS